MKTDPVEAARLFEAWGNARSWAGPDPYDALNARRVPCRFLRSAIGRRVLTQIVKRSALDLRPFLGIDPRRSAAALATWSWPMR